MTFQQVVQDIRSSYVGNATAHRDYRVQLRGTRSVLLFGGYLFILIVVAAITYSMTATQYGDSVVAAQRSLQAFYEVIMLLLAGMIALITPALSATTIVMERQRRSFDLVFSAPVTPRYYLVGKMVSSFRYTWMLLILALPVTAASVVLGGAAWSDVLVAYALLSMHALVFTAISLLMSTIAQRPVSAVLWSYASVGLYLVGSGSLAASVSNNILNNGLEVNPLLAMNPFLVVQTAGTYTTLLGIQVPNVLMALVMTFAVTKITLLAAGSVLSPYGGNEKRSLRGHALGYLGGLTALAAYLAGSSLVHGTTDMSYVTQNFGILLFWLFTPLCIVLPAMSCYGYDGERRNWPNGLFKFRHLLDGSPAGALPFILSLIGAGTVGTYIGSWLGLGRPISPEFFAYPFFAASFWTLMWGLGRVASYIGKTVKQGRTLQFAAFITTMILPVPFIAAIVGNNESLRNLWNIYPLFPLTQDEPWRPLQILVYALILLGGGLGAAIWSERKMKPFIRKDLAEDERQYGSAGSSRSTYRPDELDRAEVPPIAPIPKARVIKGSGGSFGDDDNTARIKV